jgi:outer membrane protein
MILKKSQYKIHFMKRNAVYVLLLLSLNAGAQVHITLSDAIDSALMRNFDIRIAKVNTKINTVNNTYGVAGGLPSINGTASDNNSVNNLEQKTSSGLDIKKSNVNSSSWNAGVTANMVLFNGFRIIATKGRLNMLQKQSELLFNQQVQNTMADVMAKYYDIIRQQTYLSIIQSSLDVSSKKLDIILARAKVGMANEADILQGQMDLNLEVETLKNQQLIIEQGKTDLLQLMGVRKYFQIDIKDTIAVDGSINKDSIITYLENNQQYLSSYQQVRINEQIVKEVRAQRFPTLRLNTGYNFNYSSSAAGFNLFTQTYGPSVGATLQVPIFNGNIYKTQQDVAVFNVENAKLQKESLLSSLTAQVIKTYQAYESSMQQMSSQKASWTDAAKLVSIVVQRFSLNEATILDLKAAQTSFETAGYTYVNLQYAAKIAEIELKRLDYQLGN